MTFTFANKITILRILAVPAFIVALLYSSPEDEYLRTVALGIFLFATISDLVDGYIARRFDQQTRIGTILDPLADKILVSVTMIMLIPLGRIPAWIVIIIIVRELALTGLRGIAANEGVIIQASKLGKYKTIFQSVALIGLCLHYSYFQVDFHVVGMTFLWGALFLTIWSGWDYFRQFSRAVFLKKEKN